MRSRGPRRPLEPAAAPHDHRWRINRPGAPLGALIGLVVRPEGLFASHEMLLGWVSLGDRCHLALLDLVPEGLGASLARFFLVGNCLLDIAYLRLHTRDVRCSSLLVELRDWYRRLLQLR